MHDAAGKHDSAAERKSIPTTHPITVSKTDIAMMHRIERYILAYRGDDLLHDIELCFPSASYRAFFLAYGRAREAARWIEPNGHA